MPRGTTSHVAQISAWLVNQFIIIEAESDKIVICFMMILSAFSLYLLVINISYHV